MVYKRNELIKIINFNRFEMSDFYFVCPYDLSLKENFTRKREVAMWRNVGMLWAWLSGESFSCSGKMFNRHHSTVIHAIKHVLLSYEGYGHEEIKQNIEMIKSQSIECIDFNLDLCSKHAISLCILDKKMASLIK